MYWTVHSPLFSIGSSGSSAYRYGRPSWFQMYQGGVPRLPFFSPPPQPLRLLPSPPSPHLSRFDRLGTFATKMAACKGMCSIFLDSNILDTYKSDLTFPVFSSPPFWNRTAVEHFTSVFQASSVKCPVIWMVVQSTANPARCKTHYDSMYPEYSVLGQGIRKARETPFKGFFW